MDREDQWPWRPRPLAAPGAAQLQSINPHATNERRHERERILPPGQPAAVDAVPYTATALALAQPQPA